MRPAVVVLAALILAVQAAALEVSAFRWTREIQVAGSGLAALVPDGPMFAHAKRDFADVRLIDADGRQVPWRPVPRPEETQVPLRVLNQGRQGRKAVALLALGPGRRVVDRIALDVPDTGFVGRAEVLGSDDRRAYTLLSSTPIYDLRGADPARSTVAVFPPTDFRYLLVRATGVDAILGATVSSSPEPPSFEERTAQTTIAADGRVTVVRLDLGFRNTPVDELRIATGTKRFDRPVEIAGSNDGRTFVPLGGGRVFRLGQPAQTAIPVAAGHRYLRVTIDNGDDEPLYDLRVQAVARPRTLLLAPGHQPPYRLLYGSPAAIPPEYDFARLPPTEVDPADARPARLGREMRNAVFEPPADTRSWVERHPSLVTVSLVLAAIAVGAAGFLALRRRT